MSKSSFIEEFDKSSLLMQALASWGAVYGLLGVISVLLAILYGVGIVGVCISADVVIGKGMPILVIVVHTFVVLRILYKA